jgi:hypothetical protein
MIPISLDERLSLIEKMALAPFPTTEAGNTPSASGPDFHLRALALSRDFWDDRSTDVVEAAWQGIDAQRREVAAVLTERWGPWEALDPQPYSETGVEPPSPFGHLYTSADDVYVWRRPTERWSGLAIVQDDGELPFVLYAVVAARSTLTLPPPDQPSEAVPFTNPAPLPPFLSPFPLPPAPPRAPSAPPAD